MNFNYGGGFSDTCQLYQICVYEIKGVLLEIYESFKLTLCYLCN